MQTGHQGKAEALTGTPIPPLFPAPRTTFATGIPYSREPTPADIA